MQKVVTVYHILIYQKRHIFVQFLDEKIRNNVDYSQMFLPQKPGLTTFYHYSDEMLIFFMGSVSGQSQEHLAVRSEICY